MAQGWRGSYVRYRGYFLNTLALYKQRADLRAFVEIVLSISTITIFLVFALKPTALTIISLLNEIKEKKETVATLNQKISDLQKAQTIYNQNQAAIDNLEIAVAVNPAPDSLAKQVIGLAAKNSVIINGFSINQLTLLGKDIANRKTPNVKPLPENTLEMTFAISLQGTYPQIMAFLTDFENSRISKKIDNISLNTALKANQGENNQNNIVSLITGRVPYIGQQ